jgi:hypothetical protein
MLEFSDGTQCEVREAYMDADAFVEHAFHVRKARDTLFGDFAYDHQMTIYGEPLPRLVELFDRVGVEVRASATCRSVGFMSL